MRQELPTRNSLIKVHLFLRKQYSDATLWGAPHTTAPPFWVNQTKCPHIPLGAHNGVPQWISIFNYTFDCVRCVLPHSAKRSQTKIEDIFDQGGQLWNGRLCLDATGQWRETETRRMPHLSPTPPLTPSRSDPMLHTDTGGVISLHCMHMVCGPLLEIAQRMRHSLLCDYGNSSLWWARTGIILLCRIINGNYYHLGLCAFFFYPCCVLIVMVWTF